MEFSERVKDELFELEQWLAVRGAILLQLTCFNNEKNIGVQKDEIKLVDEVITLTNNIRAFCKQFTTFPHVYYVTIYLTDELKNLISVRQKMHLDLISIAKSGDTVVSTTDLRRSIDTLNLCETSTISLLFEKSSISPEDTLEIGDSNVQGQISVASEINTILCSAPVSVDSLHSSQDSTDRRSRIFSSSNISFKFRKSLSNKNNKKEINIDESSVKSVESNQTNNFKNNRSRTVSYCANSVEKLIKLKKKRDSKVQENYDYDKINPMSRIYTYSAEQDELNKNLSQKKLDSIDRSINMCCGAKTEATVDNKKAEKPLDMLNSALVCNNNSHTSLESQCNEENEFKFSNPSTDKIKKNIIDKSAFVVPKDSESTNDVNKSYTSKSSISEELSKNLHKISQNYDGERSPLQNDVIYDLNYQVSHLIELLKHVQFYTKKSKELNEELKVVMKSNKSSDNEVFLKMDEEMDEQMEDSGCHEYIFPKFVQKFISNVNETKQMTLDCKITGFRMKMTNNQSTVQYCLKIKLKDTFYELWRSYSSFYKLWNDINMKYPKVKIPFMKQKALKMVQKKQYLKLQKILEEIVRNVINNFVQGCFTEHGTVEWRSHGVMLLELHDFFNPTIFDN